MILFKVSVFFSIRSAEFKITRHRNTAVDAIYKYQLLTFLACSISPKTCASCWENVIFRRITTGQAAGQVTGQATGQAHKCAIVGND
jgi:hypothetical protein